MPPIRNPRPPLKGSCHANKVLQLHLVLPCPEPAVFRAQSLAPHSHQPHPFSSGTGQWARSTCCLRPSTLPPRNDNIASEADSLAVIGRNGCSRFGRLRVTSSQSWGCAGSQGAQGPPPHMVEKGRRGQILTQMRKLVPGAVSLPHLTLGMWGRASIMSPYCQSFL